ncbi:MAG: outer membrane protein assembly factor BamC [Gammaproteobacteria bacterium]|jgi:outer membrane protein assembly factor BamC|nr:outer membrane protein assembly factor BamC [Gammaproteobacteria bacterium]
MVKNIYFVAIAAALIAAGCSSDGNERRQEYIDADYYTRLEIPPDLTSTNENKQLNTPKPADEAMAKFKQDTADLGGSKAQDKVAMVAGVEGAHLQTDNGVSWLEVDEKAGELWPQLSAFWGNEGIKVIRSEPVLGIMETDWVSKLQIDDDAGFFRKMFNTVDPDRLDKFTLRVEPVPSQNKTKIFVSHSGLEKLVEGDDVNWRSRCSDEALEHEMLNRLALFVGLDAVQSEKVFENYRPYTSRVRVPEDNVSTLYITGNMEFVWRRTLRALDRQNMDVQAIDAPARRIKVAIGNISNESIGQERDEIAESSWLMQWLKGSGEAYAEDSSRQFTLKFEQNDDVVRLDILRYDGEPAESVLAEQFRKSLAIELQ